MQFAAAILSLAPAWADNALWSELQATRARLPGYHQEFEVTQTFVMKGDRQASQTKRSLDLAGDTWREKTASGSGVTLRLWTGAGLFLYEEGGDEVVRVKRKEKDPPPQPGLYDFTDFDLAKVQEAERRRCGDRDCVLFDIPLKASSRAGSSGTMVRRLPGNARLLFDLGTGLVVARRSSQGIDNGRSAYALEMSWAQTRMSVPAAAPEALALPAGLREVKELSDWNAARIKKQLGGQPAPELSLRGLKGETISLAAYRGKTVLLDFWTTWCPPCRADGPSLDKLHRRFGAKELAILGISVSEERAVVEKFLAEHPHGYPVALTSENEMPRPYQIGVFPTYIVIAPDGTLSAVVEGDQGFGALQKLLKKAGLDLEQ